MIPSTQELHAETIFKNIPSVIKNNPLRSASILISIAFVGLLIDLSISIYSEFKKEMEKEDRRFAMKFFNIKTLTRLINALREEEKNKSTEEKKD